MSERLAFTLEQVQAMCGQYSGQKNKISCNRFYIELVDDFKAGFMLDQLLFWISRPGLDPDAWIYKSYVDWNNELALKRGEARMATKHLLDLALIKTARRHPPGRDKPVLHYQIQWENLTALINRHPLTTAASSPLPVPLAETTNGEFPLAERATPLAETTNDIYKVFTDRSTDSEEEERARAREATPDVSIPFEDPAPGPADGGSGCLASETPWSSTAPHSGDTPPPPATGTPLAYTVPEDLDRFVDDLQLTAELDAWCMNYDLRLPTDEGERRRSLRADVERCAEHYHGLRLPRPFKIVFKHWITNDFSRFKRCNLKREPPRTATYYQAREKGMSKLTARTTEHVESWLNRQQEE